MLLTLLTLFMVPLAPGVIDSTSPVPSYIGAWLTDDTIAYAYGGSARYTNDSDASIEFEVDTTGFTVFFLYTSGGGNMDVCIDDVCTTISTDGTPSQGRVNFDDLPAGSKTVVLDVVSTPVYFDAIYIYPATAGTGEIETTFTSGGETLTGSYILSITAGETLTNILLAVLIVVQTTNWVTWLWHRQ